MIPIDPKSLDMDPIIEFNKWFAEATKIKEIDASAMILATASPEGKPSARTVLLKKVDQGNFIFYTNYESDKGKQIKLNPFAALVFYWHPLFRQIRIEGSVEKVSRKESEEYFGSRPRESCIGAVASAQSLEIRSREDLLTRYKEVEKKYQYTEIPCPENWGGYRVKPIRIEFWIGQPNRLHDRIRYLRKQDSWEISYLSP